MKRFYSYLFIIVFCSLFICSCAETETSNAAVRDIMERVKREAKLENAVTEDMKDYSVSGRYGISPDSIVEGLVYYSPGGESADRIIIIKAKDADSVGKIENALGREITRLTEAWEGRRDGDGKEQYKRLERHIIKTRGMYVILAVCGEPKEAVKIFDGSVKKK